MRGVHICVMCDTCGWSSAKHECPRCKSLLCEGCARANWHKWNGSESRGCRKVVVTEERRKIEAGHPGRVERRRRSLAIQ
jgi:hypothetical protein